ncbi:hypothetical protein B0I27_101292 [Arcticibacter pallidicorallinus]|uniref:Uncharacterized protein n=1 Tax=Arcticibacter pallidicorallinus TaxID=1259464 RepID=A0A2T0UBN4_9SPHI|nr:hypothetical protein B0I27_101292 [Arcticibacter pallidicorallinus]
MTMIFPNLAIMYNHVCIKQGMLRNGCDLGYEKLGSS